MSAPNTADPNDTSTKREAPNPKPSQLPTGGRHTLKGQTEQDQKSDPRPVPSNIQTDPIKEKASEVKTDAKKKGTDTTNSNSVMGSSLATASIPPITSPPGPQQTPSQGEEGQQETPSPPEVAKVDREKPNGEGQLQPDVLGSTMASVMQALGRPPGSKAFQNLLLQQKHAEAELGAEIKHVTKVGVGQSQVGGGHQQTFQNESGAAAPHQSNRAAPGGHGRHYPMMIPDGYQLVKVQEYEQLRYDLVNQRESIEELTTRLSAVVSNKLKQGNPYIADLSDRNRPTKLGERFGSMYDDEWLEAFEALRDGKEENEEEDAKVTVQLLAIIKDAYRLCRDQAEKQLGVLVSSMKDAVCQTTGSNQATETKSINASQDGKAEPETKPTSDKDNGDKSPAPPTEQKAPGEATAEKLPTEPSVKPASGGIDQGSKPTGVSPVTPPSGSKQKEDQSKLASSRMSEMWNITLRYARGFRKETASVAVPEIQQIYINQYIQKTKQDPQTLPLALVKYMARCVEVMWLMSVQDPPMAILWAENGGKTDTNFFKFLHSKGSRVKYCVWPAVFLCDHEAIVSKGYVVGENPPPPGEGAKVKPK